MKLTRKTVCGVVRYYPACERSRKWLHLIHGNKTFTQQQVDAIAEFGETIELIETEVLK